MAPQTLSRVESLEKRVTRLEELPRRIDDLTLQVSQLRSEMRGEFSAVRTELRREIAEQGAASAGRDEVLGIQMRMLHEDVISRFALLQEDQPARRKRKSRKKA